MHLTKPKEDSTSRVNPNVNCKLGCINVGSSVVKKCIPLVGVVEKGEAFHV